MQSGDCKLRVNPPQSCGRANLPAVWVDADLRAGCENDRYLAYVGTRGLATSENPLKAKKFAESFFPVSRANRARRGLRRRSRARRHGRGDCIEGRPDRLEGPARVRRMGGCAGPAICAGGGQAVWTQEPVTVATSHRLFQSYPFRSAPASTPLHPSGRFRRYAPTRWGLPTGRIILPRGITRFLCTMLAFAHALHKKALSA